MRNLHKPALGSRGTSQLHLDEDDRLSPDDWDQCIKDDCASWELPCLVYINARCHEDVFPRPTLIRIQYCGEKASFDSQNWTGLIETIEHEFKTAGYHSRMSADNGSDTTKAWQQWVIAPLALSRMHRSDG